METYKEEYVRNESINSDDISLSSERQVKLLTTENEMLAIVW